MVLIFLADNNDYLGYITLENGIDTFPLTKIAPGISTIDLQTLSSFGAVFDPSHNPIGNEIPLTPEEQAVVAQIDDFFASLAKSPDVDNNGRVDFLEEKFFSLQILYWVHGGDFENNLTPVVIRPAKIQGYRLAFDATDKDRPDTVVFNGPRNSGLSNATSEESNVYEYRTTYFSPYVTGPALCPAGEYVVTYKTDNLTFRIPDQSPARFHIVLPVPTVTLNNGGTINRISWEYRPGGGPNTVGPEAIISKLELQIDGIGTPYANYPQENRMYNSGWLPVATTEHVLPSQNMEWSEVTRIHMSYEDTYRNHYVVLWDRPA